MGRQGTGEHPLLGAGEASPILPPTESSRKRTEAVDGLDWRQLIGGIVLLAGLVAVIGAWVGVSGASDDTGSQLSYITSGGLGGMAVMAIGAVLVISREHRRDRAAMAELEQRLRWLEEGLAGEFSHLYGLMAQSQEPRAKSTELEPGRAR